VIYLKGIAMLGKRLVMFLLIFVCAAPIQAQEQASALEEGAVRDAVLAFYQASQGGTKGETNQEISARLISEELHALLRLVQAVGRRSVREIKASDSPTDKPIMIEGFLFTWLYEGYDKLVSIENIRKERSMYLADVNLLYNGAQPPLAWTDTAVIVLEDGRWKVDDVLYDPRHSKSSVKRELRSLALTEILTESACPDNSGQK
jgi:hypothetical protein